MCRICKVPLLVEDGPKSARRSALRRLPKELGTISDERKPGASPHG
jgi:hypothetical protein